MNWRDRLEPLLPTIFVGTAWLLMSSATTAYMSWAEQRHHRGIEEDILAIRTASEMKSLLAEYRISLAQGKPVEETLRPRINAALAFAGQVAQSPEEQTAIRDIRRGLDELSARDHSPPPRGEHPPRDDIDRLNEMESRCDALRDLNEQFIFDRTAQQRLYSTWVKPTRLVIAIAGTLIGIWLGYLVATRTRRRLAEIHVVLEQAAGGASEVAMGEVVFDSGTERNLDAIDRQVRQVAARLRSALEELEKARGDNVRSERLAVVGRLAAGIAHEIRNPLTSVKLLVQTASRKGEPTGLPADQLEIVVQEIARMETTIESLLDFARPPVAKRIACPLSVTVRRATNLVEARADARRVAVRVEPVGDAILMCDPDHLHQVIVNLLINSLDATPRDGVVSIQWNRTQDEGVQIRVADSGPGIPEDLLDRVFEPFVTTKSHGTGLGLAISRRLVEDHGGTLIARNSKPAGAEFVIDLPAACVSEFLSHLATDESLSPPGGTAVIAETTRATLASVPP